MPKAKSKRKRHAKPVPELVRRNRALDATLKRFAGKRFKLGTNDCVQLARFHLVKMGHRRLPEAKGYSSAAGAKRVLKSLGFDGLEALFDNLLERIPPAFMRPGDIGLIEAEPNAPAWREGAVVISVGRKFLGWHPDSPILAIMQPTIEQPFVAAWRV